MRFLKLLEFLFTARLPVVLFFLLAFGATLMYMSWNQQHQHSSQTPPAAQQR